VRTDSRYRGSRQTAPIRRSVPRRVEVDHDLSLLLLRSQCSPSRARRFAVRGCAVQIRGGSVIFDSLTGRLPWLCWCGECAEAILAAADARSSHGDMRCVRGVLRVRVPPGAGQLLPRPDAWAQMPSPDARMRILARAGADLRHALPQRRGGVAAMGRLVEVADTKLYVEERGDPSAFPLLVFHGAPGLDHTWFGDYLDPLTPRRTWRGGCPAPSSWCSRTPRT